MGLSRAGTWLGLVAVLPGLGCAKGSGLDSTSSDFGFTSAATAASTTVGSTNATTDAESSASSSETTAEGGPESGEGCGDGVLAAPEACDGDDLGGESCASQGFSGGQLGCANDCTFDLAGCSDACGNGAIDPGELCDGAVPDDIDCVSQGFAGGELSCASDCVLDSSACTTASCGDGMLQNGEGCDCGGMPCSADQLGGQSCTGLPAPAGGGNYGGGTLGCTAACAFDEAGCFYCGNGVVDGTEACDGGALAGASCISLGFDAGTLSCSASCAFATAACVDYVCGNGSCEPGEDTCSCPSDCPNDLNACDAPCECGGNGGSNACYCDELCAGYGDCCPINPC
ncbi:MAG: hypothetical protein IAG13_23980 [Deltaproteobacteria bacterium]|nr:hypothetical protein [Nannocystaceae bacterium]